MTSTKFETKPLFTRQQLTALLLPLIAEQALSVTIGLADTLMVSSVGEAAVSGVSLVDTFNTLMIQIMTALATGGAVVASQYIGHREEKSARAAAAQIMFIMSSFSILVAAVVVVGRHAILRGIFGSIDADVMKYAETYFLLSALSYPFIGLYNAGAALFRAQGNSKISMMSSLVMNVVNIGGNAILIFGFKMGVMGAALASLVSRAVACCAVLFLLQKPDCMLRVTGLSAMKPDGKLIRRILRVGIPAGIENGMFQIGKLSVASLTSTLGTAAIACAAALGESGDLTAGDADVAGAADACRTAFSDRMDDAVGDGDAALLFAFVANGGVIAICRGFYISAVDGNVHFRRVVNSGSADAKAISIGRCLDSTAVDGDAAALKRADPVSGNRV